MKSLRALFLGLLGLYMPFLAGQSMKECMVKGKVSDENGKGVAFATVYMENTNYGITTNEKGFYSLKVPSGTYNFVVSAIGYVKSETNLVLAKGQQKELNIKISSDVTDIDEVQVVGKSESQKMREMAMTVNALEVKEIANVTANLNQVLNQTSGVKVREQGGVGSDYSFSINGLTGNAIKYFIDGIPMESMGSIVNLSNIPVNLAKRVEVYKGVVPVNFGSDAMGGAVNIVTDNAIHKYINASYSYGSFNTHKASFSGQFTDEKTGLTIRGNGFYNYSDNNYFMREVEVFDSIQRKYVVKKFRRFHNRFTSFMSQAEIGVQNKSWADQLFMSFNYSNQNKEIQTGATQSIVYGGAEKYGHAYGTTLKFKKDDFVFENFNLSLFASLSNDNFAIVDTTYRKYEWDQSWQTTQYAEMSGLDRSLYHYKRPKAYVVTNASYKLSTVHSFGLNYTSSFLWNKAYDEYDDSSVTDDRINKQITGLSYQQTLFDKRLSNTFFMKQYSLNVKAQFESSRYDDTETGYSDDANTKASNYGYGFATLYKYLKNSGIKASYEHAYRLQAPEELLGDGVTIVPNYSLKPEHSDNINIGSFVEFTSGYHTNSFFIEAACFYRDTKDYIYTEVDEEAGTSQYQNVSNVRIKGLETEIRYLYKNLLRAKINMSYQNAINTTYGDGDSPEITYMNRIPNQPWLFGNASLSISKEGLLGKDNALQFNWDMQYVHWFYLTWEDFGSKKSKATIPTQLIQNALINYSVKKGKYNFSIECKNFTNELAYDNYKLQKPGIAWYLKTRIFIK